MAEADQEYREPTKRTIRTINQPQGGRSAGQVGAVEPQPVRRLASINQPHNDALGGAMPYS